MAAIKLPIDEVVHFTVTTRDPATGGESDATGDLVFNIYEEATDAPIAGSPITMTKRTSLTGRYRGTFTMSAANGFESGKFYDVIVSGTVAGVTDNYPAMLIHCVPAESSAGVPKVDMSHHGGTAYTAGAIPSAVAGAAGGLFIAGSNAATTMATFTVSGATTLTGAVSLGSTLAIVGAITATNASNNLTLGTFTVTTNAIAWNAAWDAEVQSEAADALVAYGASTVTTAQVNAEVDTALSDVGVTLARMGALTDWIDGGRLDLLLDSVVADNPNRPTRGVALADLVFTMVDATDFATPETGITVTATISKDGGAFAACSNSVSEISGGFYKLTLTASEMTSDSVALKLTGTGCAQRAIVIRTQPT